MEYVATISAIRQLGEVEVEQARVVDERARDLRPRERLLHVLGRTGPDDHRPSRVVRVAERGLVGHVVEHERVVEIELAGECDLRDAPAGRSEPALPHSSIVPPGSTSTTSALGASSRSFSGVPVRSPNVPHCPATRPGLPGAPGGTAAPPGPT